MITIEKAVEFIQETEGKLFSVKFHKRGKDEDREMTCRTGVKSRLKGGVKAYDFTEKNLISVFDMNAPSKSVGEFGEKQKGDYRSIPIEGIFEIKIEGKWHKVKQPKKK